MKKHIMKIRKVSTHSYAITIPKEVIKDFGWRERQKVEILSDNRKKEIKIKDWEN